MALAEKILAKRFNKPQHEIIDHRTYAFMGDGCLMEGISHEACSLAGVWGLNKLICFYDDNGISIDGHVEGWFKDDTVMRFKSYGWNVIGPIDGHDSEQIQKAIIQAQQQSKQPTLIICKTTIGWGSPNMAGTHDVHGAPLGEKETAATREKLAWPHAAFEIPEDIRSAWSAVKDGQESQAAWSQKFSAYASAFPGLAAEFTRTMQEELPLDWPQTKTALLELAKSITAPTASRKSSQQALDILVAGVPELLGGSADLTGSNLTAGKTSKAWHNHQDEDINYLSYGVREFGMSAIMNGIALHRGLIPYGGTFAVFSDYARNGMRMSALMKQRVIYVLTHDSIGLGEDGPTHQPIEHASSLRLIPGLHLWRPCDGFETAVAWIEAVERKNGPAALFLSRQNLPQYSSTRAQAQDILKGGYVLSDCAGAPEAVFIATGSEVSLAMQAQESLQAMGRNVRVVSMPCTALFDEQDAAWKEHVLPKGIKRIAIEAGHPDFWRKYVGLEGEVIGINRFGESAPAPAVYELLGITVDRLVASV